MPISKHDSTTLIDKISWTGLMRSYFFVYSKEENDARDVGTFVEGKESEKYENVDGMYYRSGEDTGRKSARSKSQANPDYELWLEVNQ